MILLAINEKKEGEKEEELSVVHDAWAIAKLMTINKEGKIDYKYTTNRYIDKEIKEEKKKVSMKINNKEEIESYINIIQKFGKECAIYDLLDKTKDYVYELEHNDDKSSIIRLNQIGMFLNFSDLHKTIQEADEPFLQVYQRPVNDSDKKDVKVYKEFYNFLTNTNTTQQGGSNTKNTKKKYIKTTERILIKGKSRIVYEFKKGKFIKSKDGYKKILL